MLQNLKKGIPLFNSNPSEVKKKNTQLIQSARDSSREGKALERIVESNRESPPSPSFQLMVNLLSKQQKQLEEMALELQKAEAMNSGLKKE